MHAEVMARLATMMLACAGAIFIAGASKFRHWFQLSVGISILEISYEYRWVLVPWRLVTSIGGY